MEYAEKILVAVGDSPLAFEKMEGWEITPARRAGPEAGFPGPPGLLPTRTPTPLTMTVTASQDGTARVLAYTLSSDLQTVQYDGILFTDPVGGFYNLECTDRFCIGDTWYLTYSAQDDTLWYAMADSAAGPYSEPVRLDGKLFYAAKHVEDGTNQYMVGWARRSESPSSTQDVSAWGGNLVAQKLVQKEDGTLCLAPVDAVADSFSVRRALAVEQPHVGIEAGTLYTYADAFTCYESFRLTGEFTFTGEGSFGLSFDYNGEQDKNKLISLSPRRRQTLRCSSTRAAPPSPRPPWTCSPARPTPSPTFRRARWASSTWTARPPSRCASTAPAARPSSCSPRTTSSPSRRCASTPESDARRILRILRKPT